MYWPAGSQRVSHALTERNQSDVGGFCLVLWPWMVWFGLTMWWYSTAQVATSLAGQYIYSCDGKWKSVSYYYHTAVQDKWWADPVRFQFLNSSLIMEITVTLELLLMLTRPGTSQNQDQEANECSIQPSLPYLWDCCSSHRCTAILVIISFPHPLVLSLSS